MEVDSQKITKKLVAVGDGCSGKSVLIITLATGVFPGDDLFSIQLLTKEIKINGKKIEMVLTDTHGQDDYLEVRSLIYNNTDIDIFLFCFSIGYPDSCSNIYKKWLPEVRHYCPATPIILVGNMKDLRNNEATIKQLMKNKQSPVSEEEGREMSNKIGACCYLECSAKTKEGLKELMETAARVALEKKPDNAKCSVI